MGVAANDDGLGPPWDKSWDIGANDGLTEDSTIEDVSNGSIGALPHLLQLELLNAILIRGDGGALDSNLVLLDSVGTLNSDLVVSGITVLNGEVVVLKVNIDIRGNML